MNTPRKKKSELFDPVHNCWAWGYNDAMNGMKNRNEFENELKAAYEDGWKEGLKQLKINLHEK